MNNAELAQRKQRLQYRSAQQRMMIANGVKPLLPVFTALNGAGGTLHWVRRHPALCAGALVLIGVMRPRFMLRWAKRTLFAWQAWRRVSRLIGK